MSAAKSIESCTHYDYALSAYADGELDPSHAVDLEAHLHQCPTCAEQFLLLRSLRTSLKRAKPTCCTSALRARMGETIAHERAGDTGRIAAAEAAETSDARPRLIQMRYAAALAVAAGVAIWVGALRQKPAPLPEKVAETFDLASAANVESLLDDLVVQHAQPLPPETTNPEDLPRFDPFVGVPVRRPAFSSVTVNFMGARVHTMRDRRAALLQYIVPGGHRVTVYVFNSRSVPVQRAPLLQARLVRERPVYVGKINGYSVAAAERSGVGYALASDLGDDESTQLMLAAMQ